MRYLYDPRRNRFAYAPISGGDEYILNGSYRAENQLVFVTPNITASHALVSPTPIPSPSIPENTLSFLGTNMVVAADLYIPVGTATISIASPGVVTRSAHGLVNNDLVKFLTTGVLPTGFVANQVYYVINAATNTFQLAPTLGGSAISTSGTQSGTHTLLRKS